MGILFEKEHRECIGGVGHVVSLWLHFSNSYLTGASIESPELCEFIPADKWFDDHFLLIGYHKINLQKTTNILAHLNYEAGVKGVRAIRDYNVYELALAFMCQYHWQLANGAKQMYDLGELSKVYAGPTGVYLFRHKDEKYSTLKQLKDLAQ